MTQEFDEHDNPQPNSPQADDSQEAPPARKSTLKWNVVLNRGDTVTRLHQGTEEQCRIGFDQEAKKHTEGELVLLSPSGGILDRRVKFKPRKRGALNAPGLPPVPTPSPRVRAFRAVLQLEDGVFNLLDALPLRHNGKVRRAVRKAFRPVKNLLTWHPFGDGS